jgi:hypothetical protein
MSAFDPFAEGFCLANDYEQASSRVFQAIKRIVEASPLLRREAKITSDKDHFPGILRRDDLGDHIRLLPVPIRRSAALTNCGATPASDPVVYGMR